MRRRTVLQLVAAAGAWAQAPWAAFAQGPDLGPADAGRLRALAEVVLPGELGARGRAEVVEAFLRWIRDYREGAEMDHGYGFTRLRRTPASPAAKYRSQLAALDTAARAMGGAFEQLDRDARRGVVEAALEAAKVDRLPSRPTGDHIASDLMAFYFHSPAANDLTYRARISRDACRGLPGSGVRPGSDRGQSRV